jgi:FKBP-type peptidyl-prolyl cis-trans isomerase
MLTKMKLFSSLIVLLSVFRAVLAGTNEAGLKYLEENKSKEGVVTLESGLQFKVLKKGTGTHHPTVSSSCSCHYVGRLIDGTPFDSSYDRGAPATFAPNQVIAGWTEVSH